MNYPTLFDSMGLARTTDPETAQEAARAITSSRIEARILETFYSQHDVIVATDDEICRALPELHGPTVKTARSRLSQPWPKKNPRRGALLVDTGFRRLSARGRPQIVWRLASRGSVLQDQNAP